jgi:pyruvate dehydrogenase E1 component
LIQKALMSPQQDQVWLSMIGGFKRQLPDIDETETREWIESLDAVIERYGRERAEFLLRRLLKRARQLDVGMPGLVRSRYINTISPEQEAPFPGDERMELRIRRIVRWNAAVMVLRANLKHAGLGGHLSSYASSASLYEVGFNHFFRGKDNGPGDQIYFQGHAAPGIYARAFLEGRLGKDRLEHFRREVSGQGLSSYPHPRLMPDFWEFPTVSMGLGPLNAIYQARFNRYLHARGLADTSNCRVWAFLGDGECDEPEALGALSLAAREGLDNLVFVINCNLQRLDGPVRGNGKIIQELESNFTGAGWNVIKVIWAREWDELLAKDYEGVLVDRMNDALDGDFQKYVTETGGYIREHFFGTDDRLRDMVAHLSDDQIKRLRRGGHDYRKLYAAYAAAVAHRGRPTVILAKTVKGWTLGENAEASNVTHQMKKLSIEELKKFRDRLELEIPDAKIDDPPFFHPGKDSEEIEYMMERRRALGGCVPKRVVKKVPIEVAPRATYEEFFAGTSEEQPVSTTMVFARLTAKLLRDKGMGKLVVPIIPDEARTFGMEGLFKQVGIYAPGGQKYEPVDSKFVLSYVEKANGQLLEEGITEAGSMASYTAAGSAYATHGVPTIPFYIFYSMFGFQRTMDLIWSAADQRARGFLLGGTAGRTTLNGEGLQHEDGHSLLLASAMPNVRAYDPTFAYEVALIIEDGLKRMFVDGEDCFYYVTLYNENYPQPPLAKDPGVEEGVLRGLYLFRAAADPKGKGKGKLRMRIFGSGPMLRFALEAQTILAERHGVAADVYSATSYQLLRNECVEIERERRLDANHAPRKSWLAMQLEKSAGPIVAVSDWVKSYPDSIARFTDAPFHPLGTDGFGRSDTREALRAHFEIDTVSIVIAALSALADEGKLERSVVTKAIAESGIDPKRPDPRTL